MSVLRDDSKAAVIEGEYGPLHLRASRTPITDADIDSTLKAIAATTGDVVRGRQAFPHPFPARMPMEVAGAAIQGLTRVGDLVLDPMTGSSTVPFSAALQQRSAKGCDVDPLAVILSRARCAHIAEGELRRFCDDVMEEAKSTAKGLRTAHRFTKALPTEDSDFLRYWFPEKSTIQLFCLADAVCRRHSDPLAIAAATVVSSLVISRMGGASYAMDLARSRPHKVDEKTPTLPFDMWPRKVKAFGLHYESVARPNRYTAPAIEVDDARRLRQINNSVDAVITSPPYLDAVDYLRTSKFSLIFFGSRLEDLREIRSSSIGASAGLSADVPIQKLLDELASEGVSEPARRAKVRRYLHDLHATLRETHRVLKPGGVALYVLGPSILSRRVYDSVDVLAAIAADCGLRAVGSCRRNLEAAKRSLPPPNRGKRNHPMNNRMTCEQYVVLRKPVIGG